MDLVLRTPRFPKPGETLLGGVFHTTAGGKGANQATAIGRLGGHPLFIGKVGADSFGRELLASLEASGVCIDEVLLDADSATGIAVITVDANGENTILVASGANMKLTPAEAERTLRQHPSAVLLSQLEVPMETVQRAAEVHKGMFILNPAPAQAIPVELLRRVDYLTPNQSETETLTGIFPSDDASCQKAVEVLTGRGVKNVIITLGSSGCYLGNREVGSRFPGHTVNAVDTTAAGDAFNGALAYFLSQGRAIDEALVLANAVGAVSVTRHGAQASMPTVDDLTPYVGDLL